MIHVKRSGFFRRPRPGQLERPTSPWFGSDHCQTSSLANEWAISSLPSITPLFKGHHVRGPKPTVAATPWRASEQVPILLREREGSKEFVICGCRRALGRRCYAHGYPSIYIIREKRKNKIRRVTGAHLVRRLGLQTFAWSAKVGPANLRIRAHVWCYLHRILTSGLLPFPRQATATNPATSN